MTLIKGGCCFIVSDARPLKVLPDSGGCDTNLTKGCTVHSTCLLDYRPVGLLKPLSIICSQFYNHPVGCTGERVRARRRRREECVCERESVYVCVCERERETERD